MHTLTATLKHLKRVTGLCHFRNDKFECENAHTLGREGFLCLKRQRYDKDLTLELEVHTLDLEGATEIIIFTFFTKGNIRDCFQGCKSTWFGSFTDDL